MERDHYRQQQQQHRERVLQKPPAHRRYDYPSFSSTLLDSIYRSIDDETTHRRAPEPSPAKWAPPPRGAPDGSRKQIPAVTRPHYTSSTSSDCSSYGGFSSSEPESAPARLRPIRTGPDPKPKPPPPPAPTPAEKKARKNLTSIRSKFRELKKSRSPTSPAARLAGFLNSLFAPKQKTPSSASSVSRSCLVKTPPAGEIKRSVRFEVPAERREIKRMTWRDLVVEEEDDDDDDVASDASSDLFELENLTAIGRYRDELPVYETTHLGRLVL